MHRRHGLAVGRCVKRSAIAVPCLFHMTNRTSLLPAESCQPCGPPVLTTTRRRPQRLGLGAAPAPEQQQKKYIKPGGVGSESRLDQRWHAICACMLAA